MALFKSTSGSGLNNSGSQPFYFYEPVKFFKNIRSEIYSTAGSYND